MDPSWVMMGLENHGESPQVAANSSRQALKIVARRFRGAFRLLMNWFLEDHPMTGPRIRG